MPSQQMVPQPSTSGISHGILSKSHDISCLSSQMSKLPTFLFRKLQIRVFYNFEDGFFNGLAKQWCFTVVFMEEFLSRSVQQPG